MEANKIIEQLQGASITHAFIKEGRLYFYNSEGAMNRAITMAKNYYGVNTHNEPKNCGLYGMINEANVSYYTAAKSMERMVIPARIENNYCSFSYDAANKSIRGRDKTDLYNEPSCYNKTTRNIQTCWGGLLDDFDKDTTMYDGMRLLTNQGLKMHSYCAVD